MCVSLMITIFFGALLATLGSSSLSITTAKKPREAPTIGLYDVLRSLLLKREICCDYAVFFPGLSPLD